MSSLKGKLFLLPALQSPYNIRIGSYYFKRIKEHPVVYGYTFFLFSLFKGKP
ncbi:hypothetical protein GO495_06075 [Chitinophaga oryziterrae]|uniref:Uncharacterized protein n=1 Tax=Chitinophaga oryziterrae TaxID=1031224 RepID=A0A6N8J690_9BACT|nr:hypothetical protein [Chitinophaga oryziterrae]MVT40141.1 hypothetical protein [Chitinophaga oryziterrae]